MVENSKAHLQDKEDFKKRAREIFENEVVPQIKTSQLPPIEWLKEQFESYSDTGMRLIDWELFDRLIEQANRMENSRLEKLKDFYVWKRWKNGESLEEIDPNESN
jgi:hypothetical protein